MRHSVILFLVVLTTSAMAGRRQYFTPNIYPSQLFGASAPAPCCRSAFPDEYGSCQGPEHCPQPTAPHCSAFGFCTQQKQYGYNGCVACPANTIG